MENAMWFVAIVGVWAFAMFAYKQSKLHDSRAPTMLCKLCGTRMNPISHTPGSLIVELLIWIVCVYVAVRASVIALVVAIIYSGWRLGSRRKVCPSCRSAEIIPIESPMAKEIIGRKD